MVERQKTIKKPVSVAGAGLHTGRYVTLTFKPAQENEGIRFKRIDLDNMPIVAADVDNVVDTARGTTLEENGARILTVEHVLAAVAGMGIDNILIEIDYSETPILDGSSKFFIEALDSAGVVEQDALRKSFSINTNISYRDPENKVELLIFPDDKFRLSVMIDFETKVLGTQFAIMDNITDFKDEIASSRTFVFLHELEYLLQNNLIKGGDLNNAIVFVEKIISQEELDRLAEIFHKPKMAVLNDGILNNATLYYSNEPARHKLLDLVGDLALIGIPLKGHIIAKRPGHFSNVQFAKIIRQHIRKETKRIKAPVIDPNKPPLFDISEIQRFLPHRPPFLLIDKIIEMSDTEVIGLKNVTMNEPFFVGHFPDEPVMPGVLQVEAMAQAGGILVLNTVPDPKEYVPYFLKIENVKFRHKVIPGDTLVFKLFLASPIRRGICHMKGIAFVGDKVVTEAELFAQITKRTTPKQ
jgi:UDP-3-O-[3-hydroxymyristoyl] N-acetylglucosamine deacetylase/3-hydroxyacyl-[acyl-carrier-protein] dehydratase